MGYRPISPDFRLLRQQLVDTVQFIWHDFARIPSRSVSFTSIFPSLSHFAPLSQTILPSVLRGCPLTECYYVTPSDGGRWRKRQRRDGKRQIDGGVKRERKVGRRWSRKRKERSVKEWLLLQQQGGLHMQTGREERKTERGRQRAKSRASEKTTEIERKRIGTTSPVSSSSILRKSSPKMVGRAKRACRTNVTSSSPSHRLVLSST